MGSTWLVRSQPLLCKLVPIVAVFCFIAWSFVALRSNFAWDDAEPEILNQAWRLAQGKGIYRGIDTAPFTIAVYPPVYFGLVALLMKFTGLSYLPAKLVSLLAGLSIGWALVRLGRQWNKTGGIWAAFFLLLIPAFLYNLIRSNVQMMAVALSLWSLVFFLRNRRLETLFISPVLAILAFYTKQTQIALPLALAIYLAVRNRRWLLPYLMVLSVGGLIPFLVLQKITGGNYWLDTVKLAILPYDVRVIPQIFLHHAGPILIFIGIACAGVWRKLRNLTFEPIDCYFACLLFLTLISLGRVGAHGQYVLELLVVTMVYLLWKTDLPVVHGRRALVSLQVLLLLAYAPSFVFFEEGMWDWAANRASKEIYSAIEAPPGPIVSQQGSFALFGRGEIYIQLFHFTEMARSGVWDQTNFVNAINQKIFPYVITEFQLDQPYAAETDRERYTPEMIAALQKHYRLKKAVYPYYLYSPIQ
jgi:hypothetical protein